MKMKQTIKELMTSTAWGQSGASVRRAAITLIVMLLTATGAWADVSGMCGERVEYHYIPSTVRSIGERANPDDISISDDGTEYTLKTATGWKVFCDMLEGGESFSGKTVKLEANIGTAENPVISKAGSTGYEFAGTFDGQGKTLYVNITGTVQGTAPFCEIKGATIKNLVVTGSVAGMRHSAGLVGFARGDDASVENTIENCLVATDVSIKDDDRGYLGGIVGHGLQCKLTIRGCAFTGSLTSESYYTGGLQGWSDGNTLILTDDLFAPTSVSAANVGFHPIAIHANNATTTATVSNVYYTVEPTCTAASRIATTSAAEQPKAPLSVTAGENVTIEAVSPVGDATTTYSVSGITAYAKGITYNDTFYYGNGDQVSLTLSPQSSGVNIIGCTTTPQEVTLEALSENTYTLTMPDADVTIDVSLALAEGNGTVDNPYIVRDWSTFCSWVADLYDVTKNKHFKLATDLSVTTMAGTEAKPFCGTFDGDGHTLTVSFGSAEQPFDELFCAPFRYVGYATIKNLHVDGAITTSQYYAAGFVGTNVEDPDGPLTIENCRSSVTITNYNNNYVYFAGFIGFNQRTTENQSIINHCVFDGKLIAPNGIGVAGFFVASIKTYNYTYHSFFAPEETQRNPDKYQFCSNFGIRIENTMGYKVNFLDDCYYTQLLSDLRWDLRPGSPGVLFYNSGVPATANDGVISRVDGQTFDTKLLDRTLYKDGSWNTLCLPFGLNTLAGTPLEGATVKEFTDSSFDSETGTLTLTFSDELNAIEAGKPYIIKWTKPSGYDSNPDEFDISDPVFGEVTINAAASTAITSTDESVSFVGCYSPVTFNANDKTKLYLGSDNTLYYPSADVTINSCRAYFQLKGISAGDMVGEVNAIVLNFGDETTSIEHLPLTIDHSDGAWYSIDGRRLNGKPTAKGIYIKDGKKFVIK